VVLGNQSREKLGTLTDSAHTRTVRAPTMDSPDRGPSGLRAGPSARHIWSATAVDQKFLGFDTQIFDISKLYRMETHPIPKL
jgi:hypothetical protein